MNSRTFACNSPMQQKWLRFHMLQIWIALFSSIWIQTIIYISIWICILLCRQTRFVNETSLFYIINWFIILQTSQLLYDVRVRYNIIKWSSGCFFQMLFQRSNEFWNHRPFGWRTRMNGDGDGEGMYSICAYGHIIRFCTAPWLHSSTYTLLSHSLNQNVTHLQLKLY